MNQGRNGQGEGGGCARTCGPHEIPTEAEKEALDALRRIKQRVREVKEQLEGAPGNAALEQELKRLREEWDTWQERKEKAARERMVLLGHADPD